MIGKIVAAGVLLVALAGCDRGSSSSGGPPVVPNAPGAPGNNQPTAPAARPPINIPSYQQRGLPLSDEIREYVNDSLIEACGDDTLCVTVSYEAVDDSLEPGECTIIEPYPSGTVDYGGTVTYVLDRPCA